MFVEEIELTVLEPKIIECGSDFIKLCEKISEFKELVLGITVITSKNGIHKRGAFYKVVVKK